MTASIRRRTIASAFALGVLACAWFAFRSHDAPRVVAPESHPTENAPPSDPHRGLTGGPTSVRAFGAPQIPPPSPEGARSSLADKLNDPHGTPRDDVTIVAELVANYLEVFRKLPVGTNPEITAALAGDNARGLAPLPSDHRAINAAGELIDRWGTPFFFHHLSRQQMEIRSAGADRRLLTADDISWPESETAGDNEAQKLASRE